jgi:hypothetical protein
MAFAAPGVCVLVDSIIDCDGTASAGDGVSAFCAVVPTNPDTGVLGSPLTSWPTGRYSEGGIDVFDNDGDGEWTFSAHGDDIHMEGSTMHPGAVRDGFHDNSFPPSTGLDPIVLDWDGSLSLPASAKLPVDCDLETGTIPAIGAPCPTQILLMKFYDANSNGFWDDGEDIVLDVNNNGIYD